MRHHRPVAGVLDVERMLLDPAGLLDADHLVADGHVLPLAVVLVLARVIGVQLFHVDVRRVGSAGRHRDGAVAAVAQRRDGQAGDGHARELEFAAVEALFVEAERPVPGQMRVDQGEWHAVSRAARRDGPFVRAALGLGRA